MKRLAGNEDSVRRLFSKLNVYFNNFRTLHWFVKDIHFDVLHPLMEDYYEHLYDDIDSVAEFMIANDISIPDIKEIVCNSDDIIDTNTDYDLEQINIIIDRTFASICDIINNCYTQQEVINNHGFQSKLDEMYAFYDKELTYKARQRR